MRKNMADILYIGTLEHVRALEKRATKKLIRSGKIVGNTRECFLEEHLVTTPTSLEYLLPALKERIRKDVWEREKHEYAEMEKALVKACKAEFRRDITGRRGVHVCTGCITYQHCYLRAGTLVYSVHMRGMDTRKLVGDLYYMLHAANMVRLRCFTPAPEFIHVHLLVDCFHAYTEEAPL